MCERKHGKNYICFRPRNMRMCVSVCNNIIVILLPFVSLPIQKTYDIKIVKIAIFI